ncbi:MAG: hypothetical protein ABH887_00400 [bacterium]
MRKDKDLAIKLRKQGLSYLNISKKLDIPKSTLSCWFRDLDWSKKIKKDLSKKNNILSRYRMLSISKNNKIKWEEWRETYRKRSERRI